MSHNAGNSIVSAYLDASAVALAAGKPFIMFETNTASCGGFPGLSDSFGAALWGVDYGMIMAFNNFSQALLHVGGVSDTYNVSRTIFLTRIYSDCFILSAIHTYVPRSHCTSSMLNSHSTAPPTNISTTKAWTVGPIFYSSIVVAEALGPTGTAQVFDLGANGNNIYTPGYAIYENGNLARVLLVNFVTDATGASTYTATLTFPGGTVPGSVSVK